MKRYGPRSTTGRSLGTTARTVHAPRKLAITLNRHLNREPGTQGNREHAATRSAALHLLEDEEDASARRVAVASEHRSRGRKGLRIQVERPLYGIDDARASRVRRHRIDVRQPE